MIKEPLNIYQVLNYWSDGIDTYVVACALVRAKDEKQAMVILVENDQEHKDFWLTDKTKIKCVGWATGPDFEKPEIITYDLD